MPLYVIHVYGPDADPIEPGDEEFTTVETMSLEIAQRALAEVPERYPGATSARLVEEVCLGEWHLDKNEEEGWRAAWEEAELRRDRERRLNQGYARPAPVVDSNWDNEPF